MRSSRTLMFAVALLPLVAGCADKSADADAAPAAEASTPAPAPAAVSINAHNYMFDGLPDTLMAGPTAITLTNGGAQGEVHHVYILKFNGGHTADEFMAAMKANQLPDWVEHVGGPNVNSIPGQASTATVDLQPGSYTVICVIPDPDGVPHVAKGMTKNITVIANAGPAAAMPVADIDVKLADYNFALSKTLTAGHHVFQVSNSATQPHEIVLVRLEPGKKPMDMVAWVEKMQGPPPGAFVGGITGISANHVNQFAADLTPGEYGLLCFLPDAKDGRMHAVHGMVQQITVQ